MSREAISISPKISSSLILGLALCLFTAACRHVAPTTPPTRAPRSPEATAYLGLGVRDDPGHDGPVIYSILPGPLQGRGSVSSTITRGDILLTVDGRPASTPILRDAIDARSPGDPLTLEIRRTGGNPDAAKPTPGPGTETITLTVALDRRSNWCGPVSFAPDRLTEDPRLPPTATTGMIATVVGNQIRRHKLTEPVNRLTAFLSRTLDRQRGANTLARVALPFRVPLATPDLERGITGPLVAAIRHPADILVEAALNLDATPPPPVETIALPADPKQALLVLATRLAVADEHTRRAFGNPSAEDLRLLRDRSLLIVKTLPQASITGSPDCQELVAALNASLSLDLDALLQAAAQVVEFTTVAPPEPSGTTTPPPPALADLVTGPILAAHHTATGWLVYGSDAPNHYRMDQLAGVVDPGGNDTYQWDTYPNPPTQIVLDRRGADRYQGGAVGPGGACGGVAVIADFAGNDQYTGSRLAAGAAIFGIGLLVDHAGTDNYQGQAWSQGAAIYGAGILLDLDQGTDRYVSGVASQGVGGPRGFGLLADEAGNDHYTATDYVPSAYGDEGAFYAMSQGVGYGFRGYDSGGIGVLLDGAGDDRYEAGEFSQGGGYYWGLGILNDRAGNDTYEAYRYCQGFGCHQAVGILADDSGNDLYKGNFVACQGFAWDTAVGLLIDRAGNDHYTAKGAGQGGAAMQGFGLLVDLAGQDCYDAGKRNVQGESWNNFYHYDASGAFSFSLLLDAGTADDTYSAPRQNDTIHTTGQFNQKDPANSTLHGLFIDGLPLK